MSHLCSYHSSTPPSPHLAPQPLLPSQTPHAPPTTPHQPPSPPSPKPPSPPTSPQTCSFSPPPPSSQKPATPTPGHSSANHALGPHRTVVSARQAQPALQTRSSLRAAARSPRAFRLGGAGWGRRGGALGRWCSGLGRCCCCCCCRWRGIAGWR